MVVLIFHCWGLIRRKKWKYLMKSPLCKSWSALSTLNPAMWVEPSFDTQITLVTLFIQPFQYITVDIGFYFSHQHYCCLIIECRKVNDVHCFQDRALWNTTIIKGELWLSRTKWWDNTEENNSTLQPFLCYIINMQRNSMCINEILIMCFSQKYQRIKHSCNQQFHSPPLKGWFGSLSL